jgi:ligand-binding sensor domain-containing protein
MQPTGRNLRPLLTNPGNPDMVFAADCTMLYLSTDGGRSWAAKPDISATQLWDRYTVMDMSAAALVGDPQPAQPTWDQIFALGVDTTAAGAVAFTGETGDSWVEITDLEQAPLAPAVILAHLTQAGRVWVVAADGVWTTANFGVNWEFSGEGLPPGLYNGGLNDLTYGPDGMLYLATDLGLFILPPGERAWQLMNVEGAGRRSMENLLLTETNPGQLWVNTDDGVFRVFVSK